MSASVFDRWLQHDGEPWQSPMMEGARRAKRWHAARAEAAVWLQDADPRVLMKARDNARRPAWLHLSPSLG